MFCMLMTKQDKKTRRSYYVGTFQFVRTEALYVAKVIVDTTDMPYDKWLEYRKMGIGGSDTSVVCGINKYKSPIELSFRKFTVKAV